MNDIYITNANRVIHTNNAAMRKSSDSMPMTFRRTESPLIEKLRFSELFPKNFLKFIDM
jgi:hypothetical protein